MRLPFVYLRCLMLGGIVLAWGGRAGAQLTSASPFLPPQGSVAAAPTQSAPLEFRGFIETGSGVRYRIYDPAKKAGTWAAVNERDPAFGIVVKNYDAERKVLVVEHEGRTLTLPERESKVVSSGAAPQMVVPPPMPMPAPNVNAAVQQTAVINPTPADEQRRLEAVAAEVARRRALREQAAQQLNNTRPAPPISR